MSQLSLRPEAASDRDAIFEVHKAAFPTDQEARLVDALRAAGQAIVSLVADRDGQIVGHVLLSPVTVGDLGPGSGLGLAPLAVLPAHHRNGIGSRLIRSSLEIARAAGHGFCVVLGEPGYYHRFGFTRASDVGLGNEYGAGDAFMVLELQSGALKNHRGLVRYAPPFAALS